MRLIDKTKAKEATEFVTKMNLIDRARDGINELEQISADLHKEGIANTAHIYAPGYMEGAISLWASIHTTHEETVITMLNELKLLHYMPEVITSERDNIDHGYRLGDIILHLEKNFFPEDRLHAMLQIVYPQQLESAAEVAAS